MKRVLGLLTLVCVFLLTVLPARAVQPEFTNGTITAINGEVAATTFDRSNTSIQVSGTWVGQLEFEGSLDGSNWVSVTGSNAATLATGTSTAANGMFSVGTALRRIRIRASSLTSGTATVTILSTGSGGGGGTGSGGGSVTQGTTPWVENVTQLGGSAISTGTGVAGAGTMRVAPASDVNAPVNVAQVNGATVATNTGNASNQTLRVVIASDQPATTSVNNGATDATTPRVTISNDSTGQVKITDGTNTLVMNPCQGQSKVYTTISQTANTQLITGTASKKTYICSILLVGADAENVSFVAGTGSTCATNTVAIVGGTTAAAGPNLAANGGFVLGNGGYAIAATTVNADNLCLFQSGAGRVAGVMTSVVQ